MKRYRRRALSSGLVIAALAAGLPGVVFAAPVEGYLQDVPGSIVRSGRGECWHTSSWQAGSPVEQCEGGQKTEPKIAEPVAQEAKLQPVIAAEPQRTVQRMSLQSDTYFAFGSAELTEEGKGRLAEVAQMLKGAQDPRIQVTGYTDPIGSEQYNLKLSQRRAQAVKDYLVAAGVPADAIVAQGKGETNLVVNCPGKRTAEQISCLAPNRRTEIEISAVKVAEQAVR